MLDFTSGFAAKIREYLDFRKSLGFSNDHRKHLLRFDMYCSQFGKTTDILTKDIVCGWISYEIASDRHCLENKAAAIRAFARHIGGNSYILPADRIPKTPNFIPYILSDEELVRLFSAIDAARNKHDPFLSETMRVLFRLLYSSGLRPGEGRRVQISDIDFTTGEILIRKSKKNKDRLIVVSDDMRKLLFSYRNRRMMLPFTDNSLFVHTNGIPLKEYEINGYMRQCWKAANPDVEPQSLPKLRPYDLRHLFASTLLQKWLDEGRDLYAMLPYLRAYMGHVHFEDTAYYIHILPDRLSASQGINWQHIDSIGLEGSIWQH